MTSGGSIGADGVIVVERLSKRYGPVNAVSNLSFSAPPGVVTGFLGPNGSGKTTTLRIVLGLVRPDAGAATIGGLPWGAIDNPATVVGAVLEAQSFHPGRTGIQHLRIYTAAAGLPDSRAQDALRLVGLDNTGSKIGGYSLGMRQRLALATALLGDPRILVLDEPSNGLDPEGMAWLRGFLTAFARSGRTVLVSSHLLAELEQTVDNVVIITRGTCVYSGHVEQLRAGHPVTVFVQCSDNAELAAALTQHGITEIEATQDGRLAVTRSTPERIGQVALAAGIAVYGMVSQGASLEDVFLRLTGTAAAQWGPPGAPDYWGGPR